MNILNWLNSIDHCRFDISAIKAALDLVLAGHRKKLFAFPMTYHRERRNLDGGYFETSVPRPELLYRGRRCDDKFHRHAPVRLEDLSYHRDPSKVRLNRANRAQTPMFYASNKEAGAYQEMGVQKGDHIIVSYWKIHREMKVLNLGYTSLLDRSVRMKEDSSVTQDQREYLNSYKGKRIEFFLTELFTALPEDEGDHKRYVYSISAAVSEKLLEGPFVQDKGIDGLLYPSVRLTAGDLEADNLAIKPDAVDRCLLWKKAEEIEIEEVIGEGAFRIRRLDSSHRTDDKGNLVWNNQPDRLYGNGKCFQVGTGFLLPVEAD